MKGYEKARVLLIQKKKIWNAYVDLDVAEREFFSDLRVLKFK